MPPDIGSGRIHEPLSVRCQYAAHGPLLMAAPGLSRLHLVRNSCRACESTELLPVLSYGDMPRPDALLTPSQLLDLEPRHDLDLVLCDNCSLLQVTQTVSRGAIYDDTYRCFVSDSPELVEAAGVY